MVKLNERGFQMKSFCKALKNKSGEGHIGTAVKIVIAVVIGAVIIGGLYLLFNNVVLPQMKTEVDGMMDYDSNGATVRRVLDDESGTYVLRYSYDGKHWQDAQMPSYGDGASVYQLISGGESGKEQAALVKLDNTYSLIVSTDGVNWTERFSVKAQTVTHFYYGTSTQLPNTAVSFSGEKFVFRYGVGGSTYYTAVSSQVATWSRPTWSDLIPARR